MRQSPKNGDSDEYRKLKLLSLLKMDERKKIKARYNKLIKSEIFEFPKKGTINISDKMGIYIIYDKAETVLHVGRTLRGQKGLNQRLNNHLHGKSSFMRVYFNREGKKLREGYKFRLIEIKDSRKRALLEALATGLLCPQHIGLGEAILKQ